MLEQLICAVFGHRYIVERVLNPGARKVGCTRCEKRWAMHDGTRRQLNETTIIYTTAADALATIGARCMRTNRYGATGDELQAIRAALDIYGQLIAVAPRGLVCRALKQAQKMVNDQLKAAHKANQQEHAA